MVKKFFIVYGILLAILVSLQFKKYPAEMNAGIFTALKDNLTFQDNLTGQKKYAIAAVLIALIAAFFWNKRG